MFEISYGGAVIAGLLSFLSPCILPMVPFYLSYMAGISMQELRTDGESNRSLDRILRKSREDYRALRSTGVGGLPALAWKNLSKLPQFLKK